jgi:hypothetical protein
VKAVRNAEHVLAQNEHTECAEGMEQDQGAVGIVEVETPDNNELRYHDGMPGYHHGGKITEEDLVPPGKTQFREGKCRQGTGEELDQSYGCSKPEGIKKITKIVYFDKNSSVIAHENIFGYPFDGVSENFHVCFERGAHHPNKRNNHDIRNENTDYKKYDTGYPGGNSHFLFFNHLN